jgi:hypothetical protein
MKRVGERFSESMTGGAILLARENNCQKWADSGQEKGKQGAHDRRNRHFDMLITPMTTTGSSNIGDEDPREQFYRRSVKLVLRIRRPDSEVHHKIKRSA